MIGATVGNFEIISQLGKGGMGAVYLAEHKSIRTKVAIKVLQEDVSSNQVHVQRFQQEAIAVGQIPHSGIVRIFDHGLLPNGQAYLVMEFLEGETLTRRIAKRSRLAIGEVADYGRQLASVLDATHGAGITHRDLKPDNVYLVRDAELARGERVKVLDFGIAKLVKPGAGPRMTSLNQSSIGTPSYMSPEQWHSLAEVDWRTDAYALGCVVFEMACGRPPFLGDSMAELCAQHLTDPPPAPSSLVPGLPRRLDELIARLLEKEPAGRPTMREVMQVFVELGHDEGIGLTTLPPSRMSPFVAPAPATRAEPTAAPAATAPAATAPATTKGPRRVGLLVALGALAVACIAGAVVITSGSSEPSGSSGSSEPRSLDGGPTAGGSLPGPPAEVAPVATGTTDAALAAAPADAAVLAVDAAIAARTIDPADGDPNADDPPAGDPIAADPLRPAPRPARLTTLPSPVTGVMPTVTVPLPLTVCFDATGAVTSVAPKTAPVRVRSTIQKWKLPPHRVGGVARPACGPLTLKPAPRVARDPAMPEALSNAAIRDALAAHRAAFDACVHDRVDGKVTLRVKVAPGGQTRLTGATGIPGDDHELRTCLIREVASLRFPATRRGGIGVWSARYRGAPEERDDPPPPLPAPDDDAYGGGY